MKTKSIGILALAMAVLACIVALIIDGCKGGRADTRQGEEKTMRTRLPDTLNVVTLSGPTSYFTYRDSAMGADYDLASRFARDNGMKMNIMVASDVKEAIKMLRNGEADLIAYDVPRIDQYRNQVQYVGHKNITHQVLVQPKSDTLINDVTRMIGHTVYVQKNSRYQYRLQNLNDELGGGIGIEAVVSDTIDIPDLVRFVADGDIPLTVVDSDLAAVCKEHFDNIDTSLAVSMDQISSWAVAPGDTVLAKAIDKWAATADVSDSHADVQKKYFEHFVMAEEQSKDAAPTVTMPDGQKVVANAPLRSDGTISAYDALFRKHAASIGWDWRQMAAIGYTESKFNPTITSWAGAKGLMQLMPASARQFGVADRITDPDANIYGAARILESLEKSLRDKVADPAERRKFVIASYNSGLGHILDAMALARKYGKNPQVWYGNVAEMAMLKTQPQYYNDPVVKHGYFRAKETVQFVDRVLGTYRIYCEKVPR